MVKGIRDVRSALTYYGSAGRFGRVHKERMLRRSKTW